MDFADRDALIERLLTAEREIVFLVGAPLTSPVAGAPGVPGVPGIVERIRAVFRDRARSLDRFEAALANEANRYQAAFRHLLQNRGPDLANRIIREAVLEARLPGAKPGAQLDDDACDGLENDLDGWSCAPGVAALGRLAALYPKRFGRTVLTSNFDPLIELAIRRAGGRAFYTALHGDGGLEQTRGQGCHVVHVHGYWYGIDTLHSPAQLGQDRPQLRASLARIFRNRTIVVMAYGGWDDVFTRTLQEVTADQGSYPDVLWCFYDADPRAIEERSGRLMEELEPAIGRQRAVFYAGIDAHTVLPELARELEATSKKPSMAMMATGGPARHDAEFIGRTSERDAVLEALDHFQPVQLLGARRMGKSSLLRWIERHARAMGREVAFANARGLAGRSPSELVLALGDALGRREAVKGALFAESAIPSVRSAERALSLLSPALLLVDEADALGEEDHGFDKSFFDELRALGQERKLQWISASERDLFEVFRTTGLTSAFLDDARRIHVGALTAKEAEELIAGRVKEPSRARFAKELAGGFPQAVRWLADRLAEDAGELSEVERAFRRWIEPLFTFWWGRFDAPSRALLKRCREGAVKAGDLADADRRRARTLADCGFLVEGDAGFALEGRAFQDFVRDAA